MIRLTRSKIQSLAANEAVFQRGLAYFKDKRVVHAACSKNKKLYTFTIQGNQKYRVTVEETPEQDVEVACNCPAMYSQKGACKHSVAALLYLQQYLEQKEKKTGTPANGDSRTGRIIRYFMDAGEPHYDKDVYRIEPCIEIPGLLRTDNDPVYISLRVGNTKLYRVQMLKRFLMDYKDKKSIVLGKEFCYLPNESSFDHASERFLQELLAYLEILEVLDGSGSMQLFQKSKIQLNRRLLAKILSQCKGLIYSLNLSGNELEQVRFIKGNPRIEYDISMQDGFLTMDYKENEKVIPITADGSLLLRDNALYLPDARFMKTYLPFYSSLGDDKPALVFEETERDNFLEYVLPVIHDSMQVEIPEEVQDRYLSLPFSAKFYFDLFHDGVQATVSFVYGDYEFNMFDSPNVKGGYILVREKEKEEEVCATLASYGFEPHNGFYLLKQEEQIYTLLTEGLNELANHAELFSSDAFAAMRLRRNTGVRMGISLPKGEDLLQVEFQYDDISGAELRAIFYSYRQKKKYHRLNDGSFLDLTDEMFVKAADLLDNMNLSYRDFDKNGMLKISKSHAVYLESTPQEYGFEVTKGENFSAFLEKLHSPEASDYQVPEQIRIPLRGYQKTGFSWLRMLSDNGFGGILADDMGLGKTLQSITYMASIVKEESFTEVPFLVVCPTSLVYNWLDEVENYAPELRAKIIHGTPEERRAMLADSSDCDLFITSYPLLRRDLTAYESKQFHTVFIDEAQFIKNAMTGNARSVKALHSKTKIALTGTPIENSLSELWSIFDFIMPGYLFSYTRFAKRFERPAAKGETEVLQQLSRRIKPFLLRRMKKDVLAELPDKIETKLVTELTDEQRKLYLSYAKQARDDISDEISRVGFERSRMQILAALTRLRQICCHPGMFLEEYEGGSGKVSLFLEIMEELRENGHRILVFSQFTSMLELLKDALNEAEVPFFYLCGATKPEERRELVKRFNEGEGDLFLISLKAGGTGLNLTGADTVIHFDPWWNPAVEDQASDRAHRIGQEKNVHIIKLLTKGTIEEKIFRLQQKKQDLFNAVIEAGETFLNKLTEEEIRELFADPETE
ncbi:MAG: SNF2 helicase associated domain-containing protein [Lachnospiraceae bacterium]|nr:SNF2 helicase associated domain-containing protein [Lachnospiraceae bacterium]